MHNIVVNLLALHFLVRRPFEKIIGKLEERVPISSAQLVHTSGNLLVSRGYGLVRVTREELFKVGHEGDDNGAECQL